MPRKQLIYLLVAFLFILTSCGKGMKVESAQTEIKLSSKTEFLLGTVVTIKIYEENKENVLEDIFDRIKDLEKQISAEMHDSTINEINKHAGVKPINVSDDIFELVEVGIKHSEQSGGLFDISIGPLTKLWHIGFPDARKPHPSEIEEALERINYENILLDASNQTIYLEEKGMMLDLGAIAKGFITDEVVKKMEEHHITSAIIDLGGNIYALGRNPQGEKWSIGIQDPYAKRGDIIGKIEVEDKSVVTSGIYERYLEVDGVKYHHLLNPQDGYPFQNDLAGVTIITSSSIDADALSTAVFAKGMKDGMKYVEELQDTEAIFIDHDKNIYLTPGIHEKFILTNDDFTIHQ